MQGYYNEYEELFPIIDNLSEETLGVSRAIEASSAVDIARAIKDGLFFLVFQQSIQQAIGFLGEKKDGAAKPEWDYKSIRDDAATFLLAALPEDSRLRQEAAKPRFAETVAAKGDMLLDEEIDMICGIRASLIELEKLSSDLACLTKGTGQLGSLARRAITPQAVFLAEHIRQRVGVLPGQNDQTFEVYIFGHTHKAFRGCRLEDLQSELTPNPLLLNSGAWQRVADENQLLAIQNEENIDNDEALLKLTPNDLHPCYTHIRVPKHGDINSALNPRLEYWVLDPATRKWGLRSSCPYPGAGKLALSPDGCE